MRSDRNGVKGVCMASTTISPLTRIEGHLAIHLEVSDGDGACPPCHERRCAGEMFRGFEKILQGRDPLDAQQITQRICGVCPISHAIASVQAQEMAYGIKPTRNGRLLQNLILAANYLQSHVLHFYHLAALDFVDIKAVLEIRGQGPHAPGPAGVGRTGPGQHATSFRRPRSCPATRCDQYVKTDEANWGLIANYAKALEIRTIATKWRPCSAPSSRTPPRLSRRA